MSYYETLRDKVKMECEIQDFKEVNNCINGILPHECKDNKIKVDIIKSLICHFEGKLNKANYLMVITIGFALVICAISLFGLILDKEKNVIVIAILGFFILGITSYVGYESSKKKKSDYKDTFILKALNFKLDELNMKSESSKETEITNDPDETRGYREYVVRVYER